MPPSLNFSQLDFVKPSSGFHPVTWERVIGDVDITMDLPSKKHHHHGVFRWMIIEAKGQPNELIPQDL